MRKVELVLIALVAVCAVSTPLFADSIYSYTGNNFTDVYGSEPYTTSDSIQGSITTATALAPGSFNFFFGLPAFSFFDGLHTIDQTNADFALFILLTDASGNIVDWSVNLGGGGVS